MAAGGRRAGIEEADPLIVEIFVSEDVGGCEDCAQDGNARAIEDARARACAEGRPLVILERPILSRDARERREKKVVSAAAELIRSYIEEMERKIRLGLASAAEAEDYRRWYAKNVKEN